jgi:hypothetical protein
MVQVRIRILWTTAAQRRAVAWILLSGIWAAATMFMWVDRPWWNPPWRGMAFAGIGTALFMFALALWVTKGRRWALWALSIILGIWALGVATVALVRIDFWTGIFSVAQIGYVGWTLNIFWQNARRSYVDPAWRWFQGSPIAIPHLTCKVGNKPFRVARFDLEGAFLFSPDKLDRKFAHKRTYHALSFEFEGHVVETRAIPVSESSEGIGFQFDSEHGATSKHVGDLFERMKGRGYATDYR